MSAIAGGAGGGALLLMVTELILLCILIMRKAHGTSQSKLHTSSLLLFFKHGFNSVYSSICVSFLSLSISFSPKPDSLNF